MHQEVEEEGNCNRKTIINEGRNQLNELKNMKMSQTKIRYFLFIVRVRVFQRE